MARFDFTIDDFLNGNQEDAVQREIRKELKTPNSFLKTTRSQSGTSNTPSLFSMGELMMGIPAYNEGEHVLGFQEKVFSQVLAVSLGHASEEDETISGKIAGKSEYANPVDYLVPGDIRGKANDFVKRIGAADVEISDDYKDQHGDIYDLGGIDARDIFKGTAGTEESVYSGSVSSGVVDTVNGLTGSNGRPISVDPSIASGDDKKNRDNLLKMASFNAIAPEGSSIRTMVSNGFIKPPLIKCWLVVFQQIILCDMQIFNIRQKANGVGYSNHSYASACDVFNLAWADDPTVKFNVQNQSMDPILQTLYDILNSMIGVDRPDEIGGPLDGPRRNEKGFYQNGDHYNHIHIGYEYEGDPNGGWGGTRAPR